MLFSFEVQKGDVFGSELPPTHFHANAVNQVVAVSLDDEAPSLAGLAREKAAQFRLCTRVKMHLWLLE
jgi:hypothetical protein